MKINNEKVKIAGGTDRCFCTKCRKFKVRGKGNICKYCME